jgi:hypothetical protein
MTVPTWKQYADQKYTYRMVAEAINMPLYNAKILIRREDPESADRIARNGKVAQQKNRRWNQIPTHKKGLL